MSNKIYPITTSPEEIAQQLRDLEGKEPSPREVAESVAYNEILERRRQGDWSDFRYKFQMEPRHEQSVRDYCTKHGLNYEAEWRQFNDTRTVSPATTFPEMKAERQWYIRRVLPKSLDVYLRFMEALEIKVLVYETCGVMADTCDIYTDAPTSDL